MKILLIGILFTLNSCDGCGNNSKGNLNSAEPYFQVELKPEATSLFTDQTVRITLDISFKEEKTSKVYKIRDIKVTKGELYYCDEGCYSETYHRKRVMAGNDFRSRADDSLQLIFKPSGQIGQAQIELTLTDFEGNKSTASLILEVKHSFKIELCTRFNRIFTSQAKPVDLDILSNDEETTTAEIYTVTKVETAYGELQFPNGEVVKPGSKLKDGFQELMFKAQKELEEFILKRECYLSGTYSTGKAKGMVKLTVEDQKGNEHNAEVNFEIMPIMFHVKIANIRWDKHEPDITLPKSEFNFSFVGEWEWTNKLWDKGFAELVLEIKDIKDTKSSASSCSQLRDEFGKKAWKLVSWKSSDGSPVTMVDLGGDELAEFLLSVEANNYFYFKLNNIKLGVPAIITLQIEGPCHTIQEVIVELSPGHKAMMLGKNINQFFKDTRALNEKVINNLKLKLASYPYEVKNAKSLSEQAEEQLTYFEQSWKQVKDLNELARFLPVSSMENLKEIYIEIQLLKDNKYKLDTYYNF